MTQFQTGVGRPIYNLQEFLRVIALSNENVETVVPDGIFGPETERAVLSFQAAYFLPQTGEVDNDTWDKIVEVYNETIIYTTPVLTQLFPSPDHVIRKGDRADFHYPIHAVIYTLSKQFDNIDDFDEINDLHDGDVFETTKQLQALMGMDCSGELDIKCWSMLSRLYENAVSKKNFERDAKNEPVVPIKDNVDKKDIQKTVTMQEIEKQIQLEREKDDGRAGIITPRLEPESREVDENVQETEQTKEVRVVQPVRGRTKMPPLKWNLK